VFSGFKLRSQRPTIHSQLQLLPRVAHGDLVQQNGAVSIILDYVDAASTLLHLLHKTTVVRPKMILAKILNYLSLYKSHQSKMHARNKA
jgi:hypothetical protein